MQAADCDGSTEFIAQHDRERARGQRRGASARRSTSVSRLAKENPDKTVFCLDPVVCPCSDDVPRPPGVPRLGARRPRRGPRRQPDRSSRTRPPAGRRSRSTACWRLCRTVSAVRRRPKAPLSEGHSFCESNESHGRSPFTARRWLLAADDAVDVVLFGDVFERHASVAEVGQGGQDVVVAGQRNHVLR